jgi:hypothetical protein
MSESDEMEKFVRVNDKSGKEFICPANALRDPESVMRMNWLVALTPLTFISKK